jgi:hypothetical protein
MHKSSLSFSSMSDSSSQLSSPETRHPRMLPHSWTFLTSERTAHSTHKGAILKLYRTPPGSLSFAEFNKLCECWPKVPSSQDMQPERKLIFIGMLVNDLCNIYSLFSCSPSTHHWCSSWSLVSLQCSPQSTYLSSKMPLGLPFHRQPSRRIPGPNMWHMSQTSYSGCCYPMIVFPFKLSQLFFWSPPYSSICTHSQHLFSHHSVILTYISFL